MYYKSVNVIIFESGEIMKNLSDAKISNTDVEKFILDYMADPALNTMKEIEEFAFDAPIVGFSSAMDSYYSFYKNHIDKDFYRLPEEWLKSVYKRDFDPANISIVS